MTISTTTPSTSHITPTQLHELYTLASDAKARAYCPYSQFRVGCALLLSTGTYHTGSNVEIASTPCGICAERCAIAPVIASYPNPLPSDPPTGVQTVTGPDSTVSTVSDPAASITTRTPNPPKIVALAVSTDISPPASPCGFCRQFIREFCEDDMPIYMFGSEGEEKPVVSCIAELLPMSFRKGDLDRNQGGASWP